MLASGASLRPVPSATSMVFCNSRSSGWASMSKVSVTWNSWGQQPGHGYLVLGPVQNWLGDRAAGLGKGLYRLVRRHPSGLEVHFGGAPVIAIQERPQQFREMAALGARRGDP